jgi:RNA polymerase sigma-70 factor (ECF subfamily)
VLRRFDGRSRLRRFLSGLATTAAPRSDPHPIHAVGALARALEAMPKELRVPWVLHHVEGETLPDVAALVGVSLATVKRRIKEAEARLGELSHAS